MVLYGQQIFYFYPKNSTPEVSIQVNVLHTAVSERLHFFILPVFLFSFTILWLVFISPSMSTGQLKWVSHRIESSVTGYRNMITSTPKERRNRVAFILVRCLKRPPPPASPLTMWQPHFKPPSTASFSRSLIWSHTADKLKASLWSDSILKRIPISQQPFITTHLSKGGQRRKGTERTKRNLGGNAVTALPAETKRRVSEYLPLGYSPHFLLDKNASRKALSFRGHHFI